MRSYLLPLAAILAVSSPALAYDDGAGLTRIEPRNFYGASITKEAGVHVYRTLPRTQNYIINPDHKTPLNLTIENRTERIFPAPLDGSAAVGPGVPIDGVTGGFIGSPYGYGFGKFRGDRQGNAGGVPAGQLSRPDRHSARGSIEAPRQRTLGPVQFVKPAAKPRPAKKY